MTSWDGVDRRKSNNEDHDNLTRMLVLLEAHIKNFDNHHSSFKDHLEDDKKNFDLLFKAYWTGVGIVSVIVLIFNFIK